MDLPNRESIRRCIGFVEAGGQRYTPAIARETDDGTVFADQRGFVADNDMKKHWLNFGWMAGLAGLLATLTLAEDLPRDERILTGKCTNGVRWLYRQHNVPPGKMALMFHVDSGSLMEEENQNGLAHFTEHMVFNGSENFPPGQLMPYFESIGMEFGGDVNAFTGFDQTAFMILLPNTEEAEIDKALMVLSDQAFRASLLEEEIDKERGVILAEWRSGRGPEQRLRDKIWSEVFDGSRFAKHLIIGTEDVIKNAKQTDFLDYYRTWFRPENIQVLIVGDTDSARVIPLVEKWFGQYQPTVLARERKGAQFKPFTKSRAVVATDPEYMRCSVSLYNLLPAQPPTTTFEQKRGDFVDDVGKWIISRRLDDRIKKGEASYNNAGVDVTNFFKEATLVSGGADGEPERWRPMLDELIVELNRAREFGFTKRELELAGKELMADAEQAVKTESSREARGMLMQMMSAVNSGETLLSAAQNLDLLQRLLPTIELDEVNAAFAANFKPGTVAYVVEMPEQEGVAAPSRAEVLAAAQAAQDKDVEPPHETNETKTLLAAEPTPGTIAEVTQDKDLQITHAWLENGARVHHRQMDYKKNQVFMSISLGGGRLEETAENAGVTEVAALAFGQTATKRLSSMEVRDLLTGKVAEVHADIVTPDSLTMIVSGSSSDIGVGLELAHALLTEGLIEESAFKNWVQTSLQTYEQYIKAPQFVAIKAVLETISGNDPRLTMPDPERVKAQTIERAQAWLERLCREAPLEVTMVGDISFEDARPLLEKYIGSLPKRPRSAERLDALRKLKREKGPIVKKIEVDTITPQAMTVCGLIGCDVQNAFDAKGLELAAQVLDSRLIKRVREELGLVYSIGVQTEASDAFPDAGMFVTGAPCAPDKTEVLADEIEKLFTDLAQNGPTAEELTNAKKQIRENLDEEMKKPQFWWAKLQYTDLHKLDLSDLKALPETYEAYTAEQVRDVFRKYFVPERCYRIMCVPKATESAPSNVTPTTDPKP